MRNPRAGRGFRASEPRRFRSELVVDGPHLRFARVVAGDDAVTGGGPADARDGSSRVRRRFLPRDAEFGAGPQRDPTVGPSDGEHGRAGVPGERAGIHARDVGSHRARRGDVVALLGVHSHGAGRVGHRAHRGRARGGGGMSRPRHRGARAGLSGDLVGEVDSHGATESDVDALGCVRSRPRCRYDGEA